MIGFIVSVGWAYALMGGYVPPVFVVALLVCANHTFWLFCIFLFVFNFLLLHLQKLWVYVELAVKFFCVCSLFVRIFAE